MLTNEQRAHDFALALLPKLYDFAASQATRISKEDGDTFEVRFDVFDQYWKTYELALEAFNKKFPGQ